MIVLEFETQGQRFAVPLDAVRRVLPAAQPARLPGVPGPVLGVLNVGGDLVTVIDIAARAGLAPLALALPHRLVVLEAGGALYGCLVERVLDVVRRLAAPPTPYAAADGAVAGLARLDDGVLLMLDPAGLLGPGPRAAVAQALREVQHE